MEKLILKSIQTLIADSEVRSKKSEAGWIIEVVHTTLDNEDRLEDVYRAVEKIPQIKDGTETVWKIFLYANSFERFGVIGTLHTIEPEFDDYGMETITLAGDDCYLNITELDAERLTISNYNDLSIDAIETHSESTGKAIMPFIDGAKYLWLETMGGRYGLEDVQLDGVLGKHRALIIRLSDASF